jgi:hypothetical protein
MFFSIKNYIIFAILYGKCESSSAGRARPCQGRGRGFESRLSLQSFPVKWDEILKSSPGGGIGRHAGLKIL